MRHEHSTFVGFSNTVARTTRGSSKGASIFAISGHTDSLHGSRHRLHVRAQQAFPSRVLLELKIAPQVLGFLVTPNTPRFWQS
jgi:hypothetical protein